MSLAKEVWTRLKKLAVVKVAAPDKNSAHPQSILSDMPRLRLPRTRKVATKGKACPTQHQRVVISRAARMGLTVKEYEVKYGAAK